jgi:signal transduction histidine kinase
VRARVFDRLRTRVLLLVIGVGLLPAAAIAFWLTIGTARGGERALRTRLAGNLEHVERHVARRWGEQRHALLFLAEQRDVQHALRTQSNPNALDPALRPLFERLPATVRAVRILDTAEHVRWSAERTGGEARPLLDVDQVIVGTADGSRLGVLRTTLELDALLPASLEQTPGAEYLLAAIDRNSGRSVLPVPVDRGLLEQARFRWGEDEWIAERLSVEEPPLTFVAAGPVTLIAAPFRRAAGRAAVALAIIAVAALIAAGVLSRRITRPLEEVASAATAVARGDLERNVRVSGPAEVQDVATAFNTMMSGLRRSLAAAADREALAAVGSFAAELAHEIRNPLGAMRLDLEMIEERLPPGSELRERQQGVIREMERLSHVVGGALELARSGRIDSATISVGEPLRQAVHYAAPRFTERDGCVSLAVPDQEVLIRGDGHALQRLFLNVLLNAAEAIGRGGHCRVSVEAVNGACRVRFADNGHGMTAQARERAAESFFTTRAGGTGLGLAVATRIAQAHGGALCIASSDESGTVVEVTLPHV